MNINVIGFNKVGTQYVLASIGFGTLSYDLNRWCAMGHGKEDPFLKMGVKYILHILKSASLILFT